MTQQEQAAMYIDAYANIQRIEKAQDKDREIENQKKLLKAKLEALGIVTENLTIE
ncbi:MAG: hypothetical protein IJ641_10000 [Lachnospiraceae bacterium]|nr:hypothetical protein [Lachnospiraceae bacterium]